MKLSMWMIANQLSHFDTKVQIRSNAPRILKSARRAYATNCVHVYQSGDDVVLRGEEDSIYLYDMDVETAFEIVQSIFDFYDDWHTMMIEAARQQDFQTVVDLCGHLFHNPVILISASFKVIAMSEMYDGVDKEWDYVRAYGYSSYDTIHQLYSDSSLNDRVSREGAQYFSFPDSEERSNCISTLIYSEKKVCGRMNVLEVERKLNPGDRELLDIAASNIGVFLEKMVDKDAEEAHVFLNLMGGEDGNYVDRAAETEIKRQKDYLKWKDEDPIRVMVLKNSVEAKSLLAVTRGYVKRRLPYGVPLILDSCIVCLINEKQYTLSHCEKVAEDLFTEGKIRTGISLPFYDLTQLRYFYQQAEAALQYGEIYDDKRAMIDFYTYGLVYLIECSDPAALYYASHPDILKLHRKKNEEKYDKLQMLFVYLKNNMSLLQTSQELYLHRNTLVYRLKKAADELNCDINDYYTRDYIMMSLRVLNLLEKKNVIPQ